MGAFGGPNVVDDSLVFYYDTFNELKSYKGEPTVNYITTVAANLGGNVSLSYPNNVYICTAQETNVVDPTAPGGQYSRFTGNTDSDNNQLFTSFVDGSVNARNTTVAYSVYLKGTGTCHLTVYSDIAGYSITPTINLTSEWTRYSIVQAVGNYTTHAWAAVRGILTSTNVYVAAQQVEFNSHVTPFVNGTRSATQGLLDLTSNSTIDLTNVSFDNNADITFDGTNDYVEVPSFNPNFSAGITMECVTYWTAGQGGSWQRMFDFGNGPSADNLLFCRYSNGDQIFFGIYNGSSSSYQVTGAGAILFGQTALYTATADGTNFKVYVNGQLIYSGANTTIPVTTLRRNNYLGKSNWPDSYFAGKIPLAKIHNRALTADEVRNNYNAIKSRYGI